MKYSRHNRQKGPNESELCTSRLHSDPKRGETDKAGDKDGQESLRQNTLSTNAFAPPPETEKTHHAEYFNVKGKGSKTKPHGCNKETKRP